MRAFPSILAPSVAVAGSENRFPVRRIYCVGQNYGDHAREMGADPSRQEPFFFAKPADAVVDSGRTLRFPTRTEELHHEVELVIALGAGGVNISADQAASLVYGSAVGLDLTRRDLQARAKRAGRPWDMAKGFDQSAPVGPLTPGVLPTVGEISLSVDGHRRQSGDLRQMIWSPLEIIEQLSTYVALAGGDLIFTGTPAGVGPLRRGERVCAMIAGLSPLEIAFD